MSTTAAVVAVVTAVVTPLSVVVVALIGRAKLDAIHVLVNDRLERALTKIELLEHLLDQGEPDGVTRPDSVASLRDVPPAP